MWHAIEALPVTLRDQVRQVTTHDAQDHKTLSTRVDFAQYYAVRDGSDVGIGARNVALGAPARGYVFRRREVGARACESDERHKTPLIGTKAMHDTDVFGLSRVERQELERGHRHQPQLTQL